MVAMTEEQVIQEFVHRALTNAALRQELTHNPEHVFEREDVPPRVRTVLLKMVPQLTLSREMPPSESWMSF